MSVNQLACDIQASLMVIQAPASTNEARQVAQAQLDSMLLNQTGFVIPACLHLLGGHGDSFSCHFALSTISKFITERSNILSEVEWQGLKAGLLSLFQGGNDLPFFVMSKLIDVVCDVAVRTWPSDWPELLPTTMSGNRKWGISLFARICDSLSEESLSVRCIAPERQMSIRVGITSVIPELVQTCVDFVQTPEGSTAPQLQWAIELINGLAIATKQSSFLMKYGLHEVVMTAFINCPDPAVKMLCVECLSNFIHLLNGQSGRSYMIPRGTREQDFSLLSGIVMTCRRLLEPALVQMYCDQDELRDCLRAFFDLLTDIRKTSNIFSYFPDLGLFSDCLIETASLHPSLHVQISALGNIDALLRMQNLVVDRRVLFLCFLACHDFYTARSLEDAPTPSAAMFPHVSSRAELKRRRELCIEECEEEGLKPNEFVGKLKNAALLCVRHITTSASSGASLVDFMNSILSDTITASGVSKAYNAALLFTETVATALTPKDCKREQVSAIVDIVAQTCPTGKEQDYLWFVGKAGSLISQPRLQGVFENILRMEINHNFPVQVAFISLCKNNPHSANFVVPLHQALQAALGGESRSWAIGAILSASAHGGVGAADGFASSVYADATSKLNEIASATPDNLEEFAKRSTPLFATLKAVLEVPLTPSVSGNISTELATRILPFCWTRLMKSPGVFEMGPNEYLSVLGSQFLQSVPTATASQMNSAFQFYLLVAQVAGLCFTLCANNDSNSLQSLVALFDPAWGLRPSLLNILVTHVASPTAHTRPHIVLKSVIPAAIRSLHHVVGSKPQDDFTLSSISRTSVAIVQSLLNALQIATDDEFSVTDFSGAVKPALTQKQLKAQLRSRNRFAAISEDAMNATSTPQTIGHRIPNELLMEPEVATFVISQCLQFRTDKALRRISQSVPTIITRWWNSVSHDAELSTRLVAVLPEYVIRPIVVTLALVRARDPVVLPGGFLHSYASERAVSGRRLASELVDHSTISIHGALSVLWRFSVGQAGGHSTDLLTVASSSPSLSTAVKLILDGSGTPVTNESVCQLLTCAKEQSLESRATLKFVVEAISRSSDIDRMSGPQTSTGTEKSAVRATSKDLDNQLSRGTSLNTEEHQPPGNLFEH